MNFVQSTHTGALQEECHKALQQVAKIQALQEHHSEQSPLPSTNEHPSIGLSVITKHLQQINNGETQSPISYNQLALLQNDIHQLGNSANLSSMIQLTSHQNGEAWEQVSEQRRTEANAMMELAQELVESKTLLEKPHHSVGKLR